MILRCVVRLFVRALLGCPGPSPPARGQGWAGSAIPAGLFVLGRVQGREMSRKDGFSSNKKRDFGTLLHAMRYVFQLQ